MSLIKAKKVQNALEKKLCIFVKCVCPSQKEAAGKKRKSEKSYNCGKCVWIPFSEVKITISWFSEATQF